MSRNKISKHTVIPPKGGWKDSTLYLVDVSYFDSNPIHRALFFSGFLNGGKSGKNPGGYNAVISIIGQTFHKITEIRYLKVIKELASEESLGKSNLLLPDEAEAAEL